MKCKTILCSTALIAMVAMTSCKITHVSPLGTTTFELDDNPSDAQKIEWYKQLEDRLARYQTELANAISDGNVTLARAWQTAINEVLDGKSRLGVTSGSGDAV